MIFLEFIRVPRLGLNPDAHSAILLYSLFHEIEPVFAPKHFIFDKECRHTEYAALRSAAGYLSERFANLLRIGTTNDRDRVESYATDEARQHPGIGNILVSLPVGPKQRVRQINPRRASIVGTRMIDRQHASQRERGFDRKA